MHFSLFAANFSDMKIHFLLPAKSNPKGGKSKGGKSVQKMKYYFTHKALYAVKHGIPTPAPC